MDDPSGTRSFPAWRRFLSAAMMLEHLGVTEAAHEVERAVAAVLAEGKVRTPDLGGTSGKAEVTDGVLAELG